MVELQGPSGRLDLKIKLFFLDPDVKMVVLDVSSSDIDFQIGVCLCSDEEHGGLITSSVWRL